MRRLQPQVAHYEWGDHESLPRLLGSRPDGRPWAELWVGTHPARPTLLDDGRPLSDAAGTLPFLLKVLAVAQPLSIQVHPDAARAQAGFAAEEAAGMSLDDPRRNYRDDRAKPELLLATEPTELLAGLRSEVDAAALLDALAIPQLAPVRDALDGEADAMPRALRAALTGVDVAGSAAYRVATERLAGSGGPFAADAAWLARLAGAHPGDPGAVAAALLRPMRLSPGDAVFVDSGEVHAYLRGGGVEVMAASDTVLRGGLTAKHVDIEEFLAVARCDAAGPTRVSGVVESPSVLRYDVGVADFTLALIGPVTGESQLPAGYGHRLLLTLAGGWLSLDGTSLEPGQAWLLEPHERPTLTGPGRAVLVGARG